VRRVRSRCFIRQERGARIDRAIPRSGDGRLNFRGNFEPAPRSGRRGFPESSGQNAALAGDRTPRGNGHVRVRVPPMHTRAHAYTHPVRARAPRAIRRSATEYRRGGRGEERRAGERKSRARRTGDLYPSLSPSSPSPSRPPPFITRRIIPPAHLRASRAAFLSLSLSPFGFRSLLFPPPAGPPIDNWRCVPQDKRP